MGNLFEVIQYDEGLQKIQIQEIQLNQLIQKIQVKMMNLKMVEATSLRINQKVKMSLKMAEATSQVESQVFQRQVQQHQYSFMD